MAILKYIPYILFTFYLASCAGSGGTNTPSQTSSNSKAVSYPTQAYENTTYQENIKTVQVYPDNGTSMSQLEPAVMRLGSQSLFLHFDELAQDAEEYAIKIQHCTWNWKPSRLSPLEYLSGYNEFPVRDYEFSINTRNAYVHYQLRLPMVKLPGNYVLTVYHRNNPRKLVLSHRFMVYNNNAPVAAEWLYPAGSARQWGQQLDLKIVYGQLTDIVDPTSQLKVVIRQNQRWDNAIAGLSPSGDFAPRKTLEFQLFDGSNVFAGGNQFRFFDIQTIRARGANIQTVEVTDNAAIAQVVTDKTRADRAYGQRDDLNGQFVISNNESPNGMLSGEYVNTNFFLKQEEPLSSPVYLAGGFTNYERSRTYQLEYDALQGGYSLNLLLKQGYYNYIYLTLGEKKESLRLEGSFAETENNYEVFVYYSPRTQPADLLVGYARLRTLR